MSGLGPDAPVIGLNDGLRYRKADAHSVRLRRSHGLKQQLPYIISKSGAIIGNMAADHGFPHLGGRNCDLRSRTTPSTSAEHCAAGPTGLVRSAPSRRRGGSSGRLKRSARPSPIRIREISLVRAVAASTASRAGQGDAWTAGARRIATGLDRWVSSRVKVHVGTVRVRAGTSIFLECFRAFSVVRNAEPRKAGRSSHFREPNRSGAAPNARQRDHGDCALARPRG